MIAFPKVDVFTLFSNCERQILEGFYDSLDFNNISSLLITDWTETRVDVKIFVIHVMSQ